MRGIVMFCMMLFAGGTFAQQPGYRHLSDKDGLPSNTIYHFIQHSDGYLYLGTAAGLVKYDGFRFELIKNNFAKAFDVSQLQEDEEGNIWFSNFNHELFVYRKGGEIEKIAAVNEDNFNPSGRYFLGANHSLWFTDNYEIWMLDRRTLKVFPMGKSKNFRRNFSRCGNAFLFSEQDGVGALYALENGKLKIVEKINQLESRVHSRKGFVFSNKYKFVAEFPSADLSGHKGFEYISADNIKSLKNINNYGLLDNGDIWISASNGVLFFDSLGNAKYGGKLILEGKNVSYSYLDREGNIWLGTLTDGMYMIGNFDIKNYIFYNANHSINGAFNFFIVNQKLWASTGNGDFEICEKDTFTERKTGIGRNIYFLMPLSKERYLMNSSLTDSRGKFIKEIVGFGSLKSWSVFEDKYLISSQLGVYIHDNRIQSGIPSPVSRYRYQYVEMDENGNRKAVSTQIAEYGKILSGRSGKVFKDRQDRIWISNTTGLYFLYKDTLVQLYLAQKKNLMALDFAESANGAVYIILANAGIYQFQSNKLRLFLNEKGGMGSGLGRRILEYKGVLWLATSMGLKSIDIATKVMNVYNVNDGLLANDILDIAVFNEQIWCATHEGITSIPVLYFPQNHIQPILHFLGYNINGKKMAFSKDDVTLDYDENDIEIFFDAINFRSRELLSFEYRLVGLHSNWRTLEGRVHSINFTSLAPGKYHFEIRAINDKGLSSEVIKTGEIKIQKPFWITWWFFALVGLLTGLSLFVIMRYRNLNKQRKSKLEYELRMSQLTSLKAQMNPHFMFNALNSIQDFILLKDSVSANVFLGKFSDLMRMVLEMSNRPTISLADEIKALKLYLELESIRFEDDFEYEIKVQDSLDTEEWELPSMIIQPFVENAIKHGLLHKRNSKKLSIEFTKQWSNNKMQVHIADNGVGRKEAARINALREKKHTSFATGATAKRLELLNNNERSKVDIEFTDRVDSFGNSEGTIVKIEVQLKTKLK